MGKSIPSFVGGELSLLKLGSLFWLVSVGVCQTFVESKASTIAIIEIKYACRLGLKKSQDKSIRRIFTCFVCVCIIKHREQFCANVLSILCTLGLDQFIRSLTRRFVISFLPSNLLRNSRKLGQILSRALVLFQWRVLIRKYL